MHNRRAFTAVALIAALMAGAFDAAAQQQQQRPATAPQPAQRPAATPQQSAATPTPRPAAQQSTGDAVVRIAVIDIDGIHRNAAAAKNIRTQIENFRKNFQNDFRKEDDALRQASQDLAKQRTILSADAFNEERRKFEARLAESQRVAQAQRQELDRVAKIAETEMQKVLDDVITKMVVDGQITLLYRKEYMVFVHKGFDITDIVLAQLDKQIQAVKVQVPVVKAKAQEPVVRPPLGR